MIQINTLAEFSDVKDYYYVQGDTIYSKAHGELTPLKPGKVHGYHLVYLRDKNGKQKQCLVHRIVCTAYHPNSENKPTVNHINHIPTDNRPENLEWATIEEQRNNVWREKVNQPILLIDEERGYSMTFLSQTECAKYLGVSKTAVSYAVKHGTKCKGYNLKEIERGDKM